MSKINKTLKALDGNAAVAEAMRQINPDVVAAYPITPSTRALSAPINIHCDHSDSLGARDAGWIQLYSENAQEAYENIIQAVRIAEHKNVRLPVMVMQDGFITSHSTERVEIYDDADMAEFLGECLSINSLLDIDNPVTYGSLDFYDYYFEHKRQQVEAMRHAKEVIVEIGNEFVGSVPFDESVTEAMVRGDPVTAFRHHAAASRSLNRIWDGIMQHLNVKEGSL